MRSDTKEGMIDYYNDCLKRYGYSQEGLGRKRYRDDVRFKVLAEVGSLDGCSIIDIGCGFGDLYAYLKSKGVKVDYTGVDINPNMIKIAGSLHPDASFEVMDFENADIRKTYDWAFESGTFNYKLTDNRSIIQNCLRKMHRICTKGFVADFLSTYVDYRDEHLYYCNPEEMFYFCKTMSRRVSIRHDYMPFEYCIYVYKDDHINDRLVFAVYDENTIKK